MSIPNLLDRTFSVTVSGGNGTQDFTADGEVHFYYISTPNGTETFSWQILDAASKLRHPGSNEDPVTGDQYGQVNPAMHLPNGTYTFRVFGAGDGVYPVILTVKDK